VLPQQLAAADILARRRSLFPRKRNDGRWRDIVSGAFVIRIIDLRVLDFEADVLRCWCDPEKQSWSFCHVFPAQAGKQDE
jgi:hypothetical protein